MEGSVQPAERRYFAPLDAVRLFAMLAVCQYHLFKASAGRLVGTRFETQEAWSEWLRGELWKVRATEFWGLWALHAFLTISAFTLTYGALQRGRTRWGRWYRSRLRRLYPAIFVSGVFLILFHHVQALALSRPLASALPLSWPQMGLNLLGLTILRSVEPIAAPWWFNGLILSAYVVFPLLLWLRGQAGALGVVLACAVLEFTFVEYPLPAWFQEIFRAYSNDFIGCRLLELGFGVWLAERVFTRGPGFLRGLSRPWITLALLAASVLLFTLPGFGLLPVYLESCRGFVVFLTLYSLLARLPEAVLRGATWLAGPSIIFYLIHMTLLQPLCLWFPSVYEWELVALPLFSAAVFLLSIPLYRLTETLARRLFDARPRALPSELP